MTTKCQFFLSQFIIKFITTYVYNLLTMKLGIILFLSLIIRLIGLNQSLWLDEAISANVTKNYSIWEIQRDFSKSDFHPPLYYMTLDAWTNIAGNSEISLRMPSVIFSMVTIYMVYLMGGAGAAALVGFNPLLVYYSQEARMYSMVTMLLILGIYFWQKRKYFWVNVFFGLSFLTFYGSVFLPSGLSIYLLFKKRYREIVKINIGLAAAILINMPLLKQQLVNSKMLLDQVTNWSLVLGKANIKNLGLIFIKFTSGRISFYPKYVYYLIAGLWAIFVWIKTIKINKWTIILTLSFLVGVIFSIFTPMLQYFRFIYLIPIMALAMGGKKLVAGGFLVFSLVYILNSNFYREDWKSLVGNLEERVYMIESFGDPVKYYDEKIEVVDIRGKIEETKIAVIPYGAAIHGVNVEELLGGQGYKKSGEKNFRELGVEYWEKEELL